MLSAILVTFCFISWQIGIFIVCLWNTLWHHHSYAQHTRTNISPNCDVSIHIHRLFFFPDKWFPALAKGCFDSLDFRGMDEFVVPLLSRVLWENKLYHLQRTGVDSFCMILFFKYRFFCIVCAISQPAGGFPFSPQRRFSNRFLHRKHCSRNAAAADKVKDVCATLCSLLIALSI